MKVIELEEIEIFQKKIPIFLRQIQDALQGHNPNFQRALNALTKVLHP